MQEVLIKTWDDVHRTEEDAKVEADITGLPLKLGDREVMLDLTSDHVAELEATLERWFKAGQHEDSTASPTSDLVSARAYRKAMREFADANQIRYQKQDGGGFYYSKELRTRFDAALREGTWPGLQSSRPS